MEETKLEYYFKHIEEFSEKEIFEGCKFVWEPINKINSYIEEKIVKPNLKINKSQTGEFTSITGNYFIDEETRIGANVSIEGPVIIGKNVTIQSGALIRPWSIIGDNAVIGHGAEIKHSIIQNKAKVQSLTFCGDSLIGESTRVGSGTILANRRFDQKIIELKIKEKKFDSKTNFFGAVIGDNTRLGANSTTVPGTCIGPYTWILPTVQVRGFVPAEKRIMPKAEYIITDNPKVELK